MSLTDDSGVVMPVAPMYNGGGFGSIPTIGDYYYERNDFRTI